MTVTQPFFDRLEHIRTAIAAGPAACDYSHDLEPYLNEEASIAFFFDALEDEKWLDVLSRAGLFNAIPAAEVDQSSGLISFPAWPESRFLARIAPSAPQKVLDVLFALPETDNSRVVADIVAALRHMSADLAVQLVPRLKHWIESTYLLLPEEMGALAADLSKGGQGSGGLSLMESLLTILPPIEPESMEAETIRIPREPRARFDIWSYEAIAQKHVPVVIEAVGLDMFRLLGDLLEECLLFSRYLPGLDNPQDYSYIWRPAVEDHAQNIPSGLKNVLVSTVRDAAVTLISNGHLSITQTIEILERRPWPIFQRIAWHVLRQFAQKAKPDVAHYLTNRANFDNLYLRHEYTLLIRSCFDILSKAQKEMILKWIEAGPNTTVDPSEARAQGGTHVSNAEALHDVKIWQRDWLARIEPSLPPVWKRRYEELRSDLGPAEHPEFVAFTSSGWVNPTSPIPADELRSMDVTDIVAFLSDWQPLQSAESSLFEMGPSPEGLARDLTAMIAGEPERFANEAKLFERSAWLYVNSVVMGFERAIEQRHKFLWPNVLQLCRSVIQHSGQQGEHTLAEGSPNWTETRKAISRLLSKGLQDDEFEIEYKLRRLVWDAIRPLTDDPDPTPESERRFGPPNMDPATLAINTVRGTAMHAMIDYALWVRRHQAQAPKRSEKPNLLGWEAMPEVRAVLDIHLDPIQDPSASVHSVYGQRLPWLVSIDSHWVSKNLVRIFPRKSFLRALRSAAWEAYIVFCLPYKAVYQLASNEYRVAIAELDRRSGEAVTSFSPSARLAEHLVTLYWQGTIDLNEPKGILDEFFARAPEALRAHALEYVGFSLYQTNDEVPTEIIERLKTLWSWRSEGLGYAPSDKVGSQELAKFGLWFGSGKFDDSWALTELVGVLRRNLRVDASHLVVERLSNTVDLMPALSVECLGLLVADDGQTRLIPNWLHSSREILAKALTSGNAEASAGARALINLLGARGYLDLGNLLSESGAT